MSKLDRKQLEAKEQKLRKELNEAADEFENQVVKVVGVALVSGLVSYGIYKMLSPKKKSGKKKAIAKAQKVEQTKVSQKTESNTANTLTRLVNAIVPILISYFGNELLNDQQKKGD